MKSKKLNQKITRKELTKITQLEKKYKEYFKPDTLAPQEYQDTGHSLRQPHLLTYVPSEATGNTDGYSSF